MLKYRCLIHYTTKSAANKLIIYPCKAGQTAYPGSEIIEFEVTHESKAEQYIKDHCKPQDKRPVAGTSYLYKCRVHEPKQPVPIGKVISEIVPENQP